MKKIKQYSTGTIMLGPVIGSSDGLTPSTALSLTTAPAVRFSKNGSTFVSRSSTGAVTARHGGYYTIPYSSVDSATLGPLRVILQYSTAYQSIWEDFMVESTDAKSAFTENLLETAIESTYTFKDFLRLMSAFAYGKSTGAGSTTLKFYGVGSTGVTRISAGCGSSGNRKSVTLNSSS